MTISEYPTIVEEDGIPFLVFGVGSFEQHSNIHSPGGIGLQQILYTKNGRGRLTYNGTDYTLPPQTAACLNADICCSYHPLDASTETYWIQYSDQEIESFLQKTGLCSLKLVSVSHPLAMEAAFEQIFYLLHTHQPRCVYRCAPLLYGLLLDLCAAAQDTSAQSSGTDDVHLAQAVRFIEKHYMEDLTLSSIADPIGISEAYLCTLFKRGLAVRPVEFLSKIRIQQAKRLLTTTTLSIQCIGAAVGYADKSYFGYVFKKQEGVSPSLFRKNAAGAC